MNGVRISFSTATTQDYGPMKISLEFLNSDGEGVYVELPLQGNYFALMRGKDVNLTSFHETESVCTYADLLAESLDQLLNEEARIVFTRHGGEVTAVVTHPEYTTTVVIPRTVAETRFWL